LARKRISYPPWAMVFLTSAVASCATYASGGTPSLELLEPSHSVIERQILDRHIEMASLNASVGDEPISFVSGQPELLRSLRPFIASRVRRDYVEIYQSAPSHADAIYLLLGRTAQSYIVFVVRVQIQPGGTAYVQLPGLAYAFRPGSSTPSSVVPTEY